MNGTRYAIGLAKNTTSRPSRSSLATATSHLAFLAAFSAALSTGGDPVHPNPAGLDLREFGDDLETFGMRERLHSGALALN